MGIRLINPQKEFERLVPIAIANACFSVNVSKEAYIDKFNQFANGMRSFGQHYLIDGKEIDKRVRNGIGAQLALEKQLGVTFTKWGENKPDDIPDMLPVGLKVGVKSSEAPRNAPLVAKNIYHPQIIT